jgi:hypothetical protein
MAISEKTIFLTYVFQTAPVLSGSTNNQSYQIGKNYGYATGIHCNYIQRLETPNLTNKSIDFILPDGSLFPFLRSSSDIQAGQDGSGWSANKLFVLAQIVDGTGSTVTSDPNNWVYIDVTSQLDNYASFSGSTIPASAINNSTFIIITISDILNAPSYSLTYLQYPSKLIADNSVLAFGEEAFFYGNVNTDIKATAYTTEIPAVLPLNQYNSTTNPTWDQVSAVNISEMGLFNNNGDLIGVGKISNPIDKNSTIYRTVLFSIDF